MLILEMEYYYLISKFTLDIVIKFLDHYYLYFNLFFQFNLRIVFFHLLNLQIASLNELNFHLIYLFILSYM